MKRMSAERFTNARVHDWLTPALDSAVDTMHTTRVQLNSAALWWFCMKLPPEERANLLGEYVKVQAMGGDPAVASIGKADLGKSERRGRTPAKK
jgi:hypothetical protein